MVLERCKYIPHIGFSNKNEPYYGFTDPVDYTKYPDMYMAYKGFSEWSGLPISNFILTNGCENAFRICMEYLKPKELSIGVPTWSLPEILCEGLDIKVKPYNFKFNSYQKLFYPPRIKDGLVYTTNEFNNLFQHELFYSIPNQIKIVDITYEWDLVDKLTLDTNTIYIGSLDKVLGCGLRLGFILFTEDKSKKFNLLREQYLNTGAIIACSRLTSSDILTRNGLLTDLRVEKIYNYLQTYVDIVTVCTNYITFINPGYISEKIKTFSLENEKGELIQFGRLPIVDVIDIMDIFGD